MRLSLLQRYILVTGYTARSNRISRRLIDSFYLKRSNGPKRRDSRDTITKSLERLIDRELLTGYGRRTPHKWFIDEVKLTRLGRRQARRLLGEQQILPLFNRNLKSSPYRRSLSRWDISQRDDRRERNPKS